MGIEDQFKDKAQQLKDEAKRRAQQGQERGRQQGQDRDRQQGQERGQQSRERGRQMVDDVEDRFES
ncbi:hypothetical protein [Streptomyces sp. CT34]|uniref:hypothetical protein n=1 Tax=Streptomyces sp. CT34 TaxID=1553907 RepID=UPI0005BBC9E7|nr:hypothetical protein [Streptomyces sp. CT34]